MTAGLTSGRHKQMLAAAAASIGCRSSSSTSCSVTTAPPPRAWRSHCTASSVAPRSCKTRWLATSEAMPMHWSSQHSCSNGLSIAPPPAAGCASSSTSIPPAMPAPAPTTTLSAAPAMSPRAAAGASSSSAPPLEACVVTAAVTCVPSVVTEWMYSAGCRGVGSRNRTAGPIRGCDSTSVLNTGSACSASHTPPTAPSCSRHRMR